MTESFLALAIKYRPKKLSELIGQDIFVSTIQNALKNKRLAQEHYHIRETIQHGYLQRHTIEPHTRITGKINIEFKKGGKIYNSYSKYKNYCS